MNSYKLYAYVCTDYKIIQTVTQTPAYVNSNVGTFNIHYMNRMTNKTNSIYFPAIAAGQHLF